jgi:hypothetical protein
MPQSTISHYLGPKQIIRYLLSLDPTLWENEEKMSNEDNEKLCGPFTEAEFKMLFFKCSTIKLQGLIAYQLIFFQKLLGVIKSDII